MGYGAVRGYELPNRAVRCGGTTGAGPHGYGERPDGAEALDGGTP
ncbi:hypothetical protein [Actinomycetospora callitridis]|nr:hypothetical protein [Actinomycetospora callitridis]MDD7917565.1 hypothetical protein [Actinomycetospora callitridis]